MKYLVPILTIVATIGFAATVSAAPDFSTINHQRTAAQARLAPAIHADAIAAQSNRKLTLWLDHGPRAETTPWLNQQRRLRFDAQKEARLARSEAPATPPGR